MARLIDADKMREDWLENGENEYVYDTNAVLESIDEQPTVDAVEVVHGEWITKCMEGSWTHYRYSCSNCGSGFDSNSNYCPNCGADMRVGSQKG